LPFAWLHNHLWWKSRLFLWSMSFLQGIIDSFNSVFSPQYSSSSQTNFSASSSSSMEASPSSPSSSISNERVAYKLKGYYDLATQEIDKAVRAEEWGLIDDAILHYRNAHRILLEANSTPVPSFITPRWGFCYINDGFLIWLMKYCEKFEIWRICLCVLLIICLFSLLSWRWEKGVYGLVKFFIFNICVVGKSINLVKLHPKK